MTTADFSIPENQAQAVAEALAGLRMKWPKATEDLSKIRFT